MITQAGLSEAYEKIVAGNYTDLDIVPIAKSVFKPYDMCIVNEMGIDSNEKAKTEKDIDMGSMFRFTGNRYEIVVAAVNEKNWPTLIGILAYYDKDEIISGNVIICPVLNWSDVGEFTLDGIGKLIPALMVKAPTPNGIMAVGMALSRHLRRYDK